MSDGTLNFGPMLNAYPDSLGGTLGDAVVFLKRPESAGIFTSFYLLPSLFNTDLDRGFSVIDYSLNELLATPADLSALAELGIDLKLDFILNHASVLSAQFQDILRRGDESPYRHFFIDWNKFWEGHGVMTEAGYLQPEPQLLQDMFFRKPGLPLLLVRLPDGKKVPYWNTFYQEVSYAPVSAQDLLPAAHGKYGIAEQLSRISNAAIQNGSLPTKADFGGLSLYYGDVIALLESRESYLGQMDLNIRSPLVWDFYRETLDKLAGYGAKIVRLDAFAYASKEIGARNFLNEPGTWELLERVAQLASPNGISLLPEIHASYEEGAYRTIAEKGYLVYDFFLPGLVLDAMEQKDGEILAKWANEITERGMLTVNMLGSHDGIPLLDLKGLLPDRRIERLIETVVSRGGFVKDLHGAKNVYYQVNATYYSALGEDDRKLILARALQMFMPGKPQVWYLDLFAGKNDYEAMERAGPGGHKEINRTNLTRAAVVEGLRRTVVQEQLKLLRMRGSFRVFSPAAEVSVSAVKSRIRFRWKLGAEEAILDAELSSLSFTAVVRGLADGKLLFLMKQ